MATRHSVFHHTLFMQASVKHDQATSSCTCLHCANVVGMTSMSMSMSIAGYVLNAGIHRRSVLQLMVHSCVLHSCIVALSTVAP